MSETFKNHAATVVVAVRAGASLADAARQAGCTSRTVERWLQKGREKPDGPYGRFAAQVDGTRQEQGVPGVSEAELMTKTELTGLVNRAARNGSVAAMKLAREMLDDDPPRGPDRIDEIRKGREERLSASRSTQ